MRKAVTEASDALEGGIPDAFRGDAHAYLMAIYKDPSHDPRLRVDAARAAIRYEKPALSAVEAKVLGSIDVRAWLLSLGAPD